MNETVGGYVPCLVISLETRLARLRGTHLALGEGHHRDLLSQSQSSAWPDQFILERGNNE